VQRALVFIQRCQMDGRLNDMPFAKNSRQGGFIYSTSENKDSPGSGSSEVSTGKIEETLDDGTEVSNLRAYGSMTYSGFKGLIYAQLKKDDPHVQSAMGWIERNYTLKENPGIGQDGLYYYVLVFARALKAWGEPELMVAPTSKPESADEAAKAEREKRDWANDLVDRLAELQNADGSFKSVGKRWMEDQPVLITAYGVLALQQAVR
jgi:squalene-hopene/tetraprenyl-beta-curcumene cyclase